MNDTQETGKPLLNFTGSTEMEQNDLFGTDWQKLVRKNSSKTSVAAAKSINTNNMEKTVLDVIKKYPDGCIQDEVLAALSNHPYSSVTARFRALLDKNFIEDTGKTKAGKSGKQQRIVKAL
jgi:hypothetical protein